jgi:2-methylcitrate dehydratase PrpD
MEVTRTLARYVVGSELSAIPDAVRKEATRSLVNWLGCAVGGCRHETIDRALDALDSFSGKREATLMGRGEKLDIFLAALLNGMSSHVFDFDDTHLKTIIHPAGPVASALFALSEHQPISGADLLHAFILGVEVECRIGNAVYPEHYDVGWHITGTAGVFGAAAAAGKILNLDEQQMVWALGIAGTQSSGFREMFGTMCKSFHPGRAAQNGMLAAFLAQKNFTSSDQVLEAKRGFANVMSTARDYDEITENLGKSFEVALNTYKPFACGIVIHPSIDGGIQLKKELNLTGDEIEKVELKVAPLVLELTGKKTPQTGLEGKFSVYHSLAVAIIHGAAGENEYSDSCVRAPKVVALRDKVEAVIDDTMRDDEARVKVTLKDGRVVEKHVPHAIGSLERPMSDEDINAKFNGLVREILSEEKTAELLKLGWSIADLKDASDICRASLPS